MGWLVVRSSQGGRCSCHQMTFLFYQLYLEFRCLAVLFRKIHSSLAGVAWRLGVGWVVVVRPKQGGEIGGGMVGEDGWEAWWGDAGQRTRQSHPSASQRSTSNHPKTLTRSDDFANKTMVTNKTLKVSNHPPIQQTNHHICWTNISSSPGSSPTNETKLTKK